MNWVAPIKDEETLNKFREALRNVDDKYYIMFEIGIGTGMQLQEILKLKVKDIRGKNSIVASIGIKGEKREFVMSEELKSIINDYCKAKNDDDYVIVGHPGSSQSLSREQAYRVFKGIGKEMGLASIGAQTMRKTFAWKYYQLTKDIYYLQKLFNHASATITYRYIGEKPNVEIILKKMTSEENERSRYLLYKDNNGIKKLEEIVACLNDIKKNFNNPMNNDAFYGRVDCLLEQLNPIMEAWQNNGY